MMKRQRIITVFCIVAGLIIILLASLRSDNLAPGQIVPGPPTTPQPTVPCTPVNGCGHGPGVKRNVAYAWIDRYCTGSAISVAPGTTDFALNYGLGGQASGAVQFFGVVTANGVVVPNLNPLSILQPGQKDTRLREGVVADGVVFEITLTGTYVTGPDTGQPVIFGNGTDTRIRLASGTCVTPTQQSAPPAPVPVDSTTPGAPPPAASVPPVNTVPPGAEFPPAL
ncbi:MAG: hypothetical protein ABWY25_11165 [Paenisporosarcina sp.]